MSNRYDYQPRSAAPSKILTRTSFSNWRMTIHFGFTRTAKPMIEVFRMTGDQSWINYVRRSSTWWAKTIPMITWMHE